MVLPVAASTSRSQFIHASVDGHVGCLLCGCYTNAVVHVFYGVCAQEGAVRSLSVFFQAQYVQDSSSSLLQNSVPPPTGAVSVNSTAFYPGCYARNRHLL